MKVCTQHGCGTLTNGGRCDEHRAEARRRRTPRPDDSATKARLLPDAIGKPCPRCGETMTAEEAAADLLDLGHSEDLALTPDARPDRIEHRRCNRRDGGLLSQQLYPPSER